jgi:hypothetical protein
MTPKPRTYAGDISHLPQALQPLTKHKRWVVWPWQLRKRKNGEEVWTKPPYQCGNPKAAAKSNDPSTWGTYEAGVATVTTGLADGIGYMLKNSEVAAVDLDHVRDAQTGELTGWAEQLCVEADRLELYREITVSGCGLRFIGLSQQGSELHRKFTFDRNNGAGIELYRNCARYITISGLQQGPCQKMGQIGDYLDTLLTRFDGQAKAIDFNTAGPQADYYQSIIENGAPEGERSEKFQEVIWHLASAGWSIEQIVDELGKFPNGIGFKYSNRLLAEVARSFSKWQSQRRAGATGAGPTAGTPWPQIRVIPGELPRVVNEAEDALLLLGREIYQRGGAVVQPQLVPIKASGDREFQGWRLKEVPWSSMIELFSCAARWLKYDGRKKKWLQVDVPGLVAEAYLHRGKWKLPHIVGMANAPFLHADGSIHDLEGYDPVSGLLCKWDGWIFPAVPLTPTKTDALAALAELEKPLAEFPFVTPADKAAALSAILTALDRRGMDVAPLHAFTAPAAGTGKGLLIDIIAMLATGRPMPTIDQPPPRHGDELKKCLGASLIAGDSLIALDNCQHVLESSFLNTIVKQHVFRIRVLGLSQNVETPNNATLFANGNNLTIGADMTRRVILCEMNAQMERPELREFDDDHLLDTVHKNRAQLVIAALTVLRAWHLARPTAGLKLKPLDFNDWSRRVREALVWLGHVDPGSTMEKSRESDPYRVARIAVFTEWHQALGEGTYLQRQVINEAYAHSDLYAAILVVAASRNGKEISPERLGRWLARNKGLIANNLMLVHAGGISGGYPLWKIEKV